MKNKILIITSKSDEHADYIIEKFNQLKGSFEIIRLNTEDFPHNCIYTFDGANYYIKILDSGKSFITNEIRSIWYRRPQAIKSSFTQKETDVFTNSQFKELLNGLYYVTKESVNWINHISDNISAKNKIYQLYMAQKIGFSIPDTIITNDEQRLRYFLENNNQVINKSLTEPRYTFEGVQYPYMTRLHEPSVVIDNIDAIKVCPTFFQENIEKKYDIRVVVFADKIFAFAIYSQEHELSKIDVRGVEPSKLRHELICLPDTIVLKIKAFMKIQNLKFSSLDFVYAENDEYYFIENNCNGQWLWLEYLTGVNMSESFIDLLLNGNNP